MSNIVRRNRTVQIDARYGLWSVIDTSPVFDGHRRLVLVKCDCGTERRVRLDTLKSGLSRSCGCVVKADGYVKPNTKGPNIGGKITHGGSYTRAYVSWSAMVDRITNSANPAWANYGGRGLTVDPRWLSFENFYADMGERPEGMTLERVNNSLGYSASNCIYADRRRQNRNRRNNVMVTRDSRTQCLLDWCEELNANYGMVRARILNGWDANEALSTPPLHAPTRGKGLTSCR